MINLYQILFESVENTENVIQYSGILKLKPKKELSFLKDKQIEVVQENPEEAKPLKEDAIHVTLIHQSILNNLKTKSESKKAFEAKVNQFIQENPPPSISFEDSVELRESEGRKTWVVWVNEQDDLKLKRFVKSFMNFMGEGEIDPEPERRFHVSLANLTGNPADSVK